MKKLRYLMLFLVLVLLVWGGMTWFIGSKTETVLKQQLQQANTLTATDGVQQELVSYDKSFFGATAVTRLRVETPGLDALDEVQFVHVIKNGPLIIQDGLRFGASYWQSRIKVDALDDSSRAWLADVFNDQDPVIAHTVIGFDETAAYQGEVRPFSWEGDDGGLTRLAEAHFSGVHDLKTNGGPFNLAVKALEIRDSNLQLTLPALQASGYASAQHDQLQGDFRFSAEQVQVLSAGMPSAVTFNAALQSQAEVVGEDLQGNFTMDIIAMQNVPRLRAVNWTMKYQGISAEGMQAVNRLQAKMTNLEQQMVFNQEQLELPEGQSQGMALMTELQQVAGDLVDTVFNQALQADKSQVTHALLMTGDAGTVQADAILRYAGSQQRMSLDRLMFFEAKDWGAMLRGKVKVTADKALLGDDAAVLLQTALAQGGVTETKTTYDVDLHLMGEQVALNGKAMAFAELPAKFLPQMPAIAPRQGGLDVPDDIMEQIEQQGLTPEIMQQLEESDDVAPETLQLLKQLQEMQSQLQ